MSEHSKLLGNLTHFVSAAQRGFTRAGVLDNDLDETLGAFTAGDGQAEIEETAFNFAAKRVQVVKPAQNGKQVIDWIVWKRPWTFTPEDGSAGSPRRLHNRSADEIGKRMGLGEKRDWEYIGHSSRDSPASGRLRRAHWASEPHLDGGAGITECSPRKARLSIQGLVARGSEDAYVDPAAGLRLGRARSSSRRRKVFALAERAQTVDVCFPIPVERRRQALKYRDLEQGQDRAQRFAPSLSPRRRVEAALGPLGRWALRNSVSLGPFGSRMSCSHASPSQAGVSVAIMPASRFPRHLIYSVTCAGRVHDARLYKSFAWSCAEIISSPELPRQPCFGKRAGMKVFENIIPTRYATLRRSPRRKRYNLKMSALG